MQREFRFPDLGEGIEEGQIVRWFVKEGERIKEHQVVGEIETEKATAEIPSPYEGVIIKINFKEGETVKVGEVLFVVEDEKKEEKTTLKPAGAVGYLEEAPEEIPQKKEVFPQRKKEQQKPEILATPVVRKLAQDLGIDLTKIKGTGKGGRITEEDLRKATKPKIVAKKKYDFWGYVERIPLKGIRKTIAKHMMEANQAPQVTLMEEKEVNQLVLVREREAQKAEKMGIKLTFLPFLMKALVPAMREYPLINATLDEENQEIIIKKYYNFGFAVDVDGQGLVVPVIKGVDLKDIFTIAKELQDLAQKAREKKLDLQDLRGGTFTVTNFGSIGSYFATPILNYPEVAILGVGRMREKPIVQEKKIEIKPVMPFSLTFDHRVLDGAYAIRFLNTFLNNLENPENLL